jgi:HlyD family secretion protein
MKKRLPFLIIFLMIIAAVTAWHFFFREIPDPGAVRVSGNIEVIDARLGFKIPGRLELCFVNEGDTVSKGTLLARLENDDQKISMALGRANLDRAKSVLAELESGSRPQEIALARASVLQAEITVLELTRGSRTQEIEKVKSDLDTAVAGEKSARVQLAQAREDHDRFSALLKQGSVSQRNFELYRTRYDLARNEAEQALSRVNIAQQALSLTKEGPRSEQIERAKAVLAQARAQYALVQDGPRKEKIQQARAMVNEAEQNLNQAGQQLSYTELYAPMDGVILSRSAEPGEYLNPSTPVVTLGDLEHPWLRAFVSEKNLGRIKLGDRVRVTTDSFPDKSYEGRLTFISSQAEFTPKSVQTFEERVKLMFRVKIQLSNPDKELKPGMPADGVLVVPAE